MTRSPTCSGALSDIPPCEMMALGMSLTTIFPRTWSLTHATCHLVNPGNPFSTWMSTDVHLVLLALLILSSKECVLSFKIFSLPVVSLWGEQFPFLCMCPWFMFEAAVWCLLVSIFTQSYLIIIIGVLGLKLRLYLGRQALPLLLHWSFCRLQCYFLSICGRMWS
jgi:hypothetical protein